MEPLSLRLFGGVALSHGDDNAIALPRKTQMLLAYLAGLRGNGVARDKLAGLIWADRGEEQARHSLRQCLFTLSKAVGEAQSSFIVSDRHQIALNPDLVEIDTWRFEALLALDRPEALREAGELYGDDFLAGLTFENEVLENWCMAERGRFGELCYETMTRLISHDMDTANFDAALEAGRRLVTLDPLREDGHRTLMRIYDRIGRRAEALKQYEFCKEILKSELQIEPEPATTALFRHIRNRNETAETDVETSSPLPETPAREPHHLAVTQPVNRIVAPLMAGLALALVIGAVVVWFAIPGTG